MGLGCAAGGASRAKISISRSSGAATDCSLHVRLSRAPVARQPVCCVACICVVPVLHPRAPFACPASRTSRCGAGLPRPSRLARFAYRGCRRWEGIVLCRIQARRGWVESGRARRTTPCSRDARSGSIRRGRRRKRGLRGFLGLFTSGSTARRMPGRSRRERAAHTHRRRGRRCFQAGSAMSRGQVAGTYLRSLRPTRLERTAPTRAPRECLAVRQRSRPTARCTS